MSTQTQPPTEAPRPADAAEQAAGFLAKLHDELQAVRARLDSSERQLFAYLQQQRPGSPAAAGDSPELQAELKSQIATLTKQLANFAAQRLKEFQTVAQEELASLRAAVREDVQAARSAPAEEPLILPETAILPAVTPLAAGTGAPANEGWLAAVFGGLLAANPDLAVELQQILDAAGLGNDAARQLVGSLLLLQSSGVDRAPNLLKDVGEAFYRWRPKTIDDYDPLERGLLAAVQQRCETLGLPNVVELVRPGDRFDSARHTSRERGLEVAEVQGWVVLRDQGKVLSRALVILR